MSSPISTTLPDPADPADPAVPGDPARPHYAFPRHQRLTRAPDIEHVRKAGKRVRSASMDVRITASLRTSARVGIVVPRYGHSAVDRNRVKRQLRELVRLEVLPVVPALDVVLRVAPRAYHRAFQDLREEVRKLVRQLRPPAPPIAHDARTPTASNAALPNAAPPKSTPPAEPPRPPAP